jgi:serine/threonine protein kinase
MSASVAPAERLPQQVGKYEVLDILGRGGMGIVYLGYDRVIDRRIAIKAIRKDILAAADSQEVMARFQREAMAAGRLAHPGIVVVHEYGEDERLAFIVMEYVRGLDLAHYPARRPLALDDVVRILSELLDALSHAHAAGIVHRDIKPANLILAERLKITDFGIARVAESTLTKLGTTMGTPAYMAPEQYRGAEVDHRADLFSVGVILYELVTGVSPFDGRSLDEIGANVCHKTHRPASWRNPHLPRALDLVIDVALAKDKQRRFQTAGEFACAIIHALSGTATFASVRQARAPAHALSTPLAVSRGVTDEPTIVPAHASPPYGAAVGASNAAIAPEALARVIDALVVYVGPVARVMVQRATRGATSYGDLCLRLSTRLGSKAEQARFLRTVGIR